MEEKNNPHESRRIRNVRRKLFPDSDDSNAGEGDNFANRIFEDNQLQKELVRNEIILVMRYSLRDANSNTDLNFKDVNTNNCAC